MRTERISLRKLLTDVLGPKISDTELRREAVRTMSEPDPLVAWEKVLSIMQGLCRSGGLKRLGSVENALTFAHPPCSPKRATGPRGNSAQGF